MWVLIHPPEASAIGGSLAEKVGAQITMELVGQAASQLEQDNSWQ